MKVSSLLPWMDARTPITCVQTHYNLFIPQYDHVMPSPHFSCSPDTHIIMPSIRGGGSDDGKQSSSHDGNCSDRDGDDDISDGDASTDIYAMIMFPRALSQVGYP